ncbi:MAG: hypothetical protein PHV87_00140 [Bacilli bacterium]|nr:hypothetical protein [Bacilli bacterium]
MKKTLLSIMLFISLFIITGCQGKRAVPAISNPEAVYMNATEGDSTYTINNQRMYERLKKQVGINILLDIADEYLMKHMKKENLSYWDSVTEDMIEKELMSDIFPNGTESLTNEEIEKERSEYLRDLFVNYGLVEEQDVKDYYRLIIAKEMYTKEKIKEQYDEEDFTDKEYETYFNNNYQKGYYAIIVAYDSIKQYQDALKQLGIKITTSGEWIKISDATTLTNREIVKAFIDLYNMNNSYRLDTYPNQTLTLNQGIEYKLEKDEIVFDLEKIDMLFYSYKDITAYQIELRDLMDKQMSVYPEGEFWYTKQALSYKSGSRHIFTLKIGEKITEFDDVKAEIRDKLLESKLTNVYVSSVFAKLRAEKGFRIFDEDLETKYKSQVASWVDYKPVKKGHIKLVAAIDDNDISADEFFARMNYNYGISVAVAELEYLRYLYNNNFNKIYNIKEKTVLDKSKWSVINQDLEDEKKAFNDNMYSEYGFPKSYGWEKFLKDFYSVNNEDELRYYYLYQDIKKDYATSIGDLSEVDEESQLWQFYLEQMNNQVDKYFNVTGIQLLITVQDQSGVVIDPEKWTDLQKQYAQEFYRAIITYLEEESGSYPTKMNEIVDAFQKVPRFLPGLNQTTEAQPIIEGLNYKFKGIELSKYKTAGLIVRFQDLGTFKNGQQSEAFDEVVRTIWQSNPNSETPYLYGHDDEDENEYQYLITSRSYHVYVNMKSIDIPKWKDGEENKVLPTLDHIKTYLNNENDKSLTKEIKTAITTYYQPIRTELSGSNNVAVKTYSTIREYQYKLHHDDYTLENYNNYLDIQIGKAEKSLKYK